MQQIKKSSRDLRQEQCMKAWFKSKGRGTIVGSTGFGKTRVGLMIISKILNKYPDKKVLIVVPTLTLKEQWLKQIDNLGYSFNCNVQVINTVIKQQLICDLLIIDEIHTVLAETFAQVFKTVKYQYVLGLTATFERLDGRHEICNQYCPVCDEVNIIECLTNGWVSPYKEYQVLINVDDIEEYQQYNKDFIKYFEVFNFDWDLMQKCTGPNGHFEQAKLRNERCPNGTEEQRKQVFQTIKLSAINCMRAVQKRKAFINNHPKKLELTRRIIEARPFSKIITFSNSIKMAESIGVGKVYSGKDSKKKGRTTIEEFSKETAGVMNTIKKCDAGLDLPGLSVGIILGTDSSSTKAIQRLGRVIRKENDKQAEVFYLIINDTVETTWFSKSHKNQPYITIDEEGLNDVLLGKEPKPYVKKIKDFTFRY